MSTKRSVGLRNINGFSDLRKFGRRCVTNFVSHRFATSIQWSKASNEHCFKSIAIAAGKNDSVFGRVKLNQQTEDKMFTQSIVMRPSPMVICDVSHVFLEYSRRINRSDIQAGNIFPCGARHSPNGVRVLHETLNPHAKIARRGFHNFGHR